MKSRLLTLLAASMLLVSCGESSSSAPTTSDSASDTSTTATTESSATSSPTTTESSVTSTSVAADWTADEKALIAEVLGVDLPSFGISEYEFEGSVEEEYFEAYGLAGEVDIKVYGKALGELGFDVTYSQEGEALEAMKFEEDYSYAYVSVELYDSEDETTVDIYGAWFQSSKEWPAEEIAAYADYTGLVNGIPAFEGAKAYVHYVSSFYDLFYYSVVECYGVASEQAETYGDTLLGAGYVYDADYGSYTLGGCEISVLYEEGVLYISAYDLGEEEEESTPGEDWGQGWVAPEAGSGVFNFEDEAQITKKDPIQSIWTAGEVTFTVDKGESTVSVGNPTPEKSFYSNPLRLYTDQVVTIESEKPFSTIEFYAVEDNKASIFNLTDLDEPEGGLWDVDWEKECVTLTFEEAVTSTSFTLTKGQVRLFYVVTTFAE